ncbi:MAG: MFS transporter [Propionibacteriaceae bacterium]
MTRPTPAYLRPWTFVVGFGVVSLLADMVYEGARSIIGPYLATLGASATVVGLVAGAGEFIGYGLRVVSGYAVTRTRSYWSWTIAGYALTVLSVPLIGMTGALVPALLLYGSERLGKAVRSPAKDTLLSYASASTGRGSAFGVHQALDQTGAVLGPLLLAAVLAWREGDYRLAFAALVVPGVLVMALLIWMRVRVPDPRVYEVAAEVGGAAEAGPAVRLPRLYWSYVACIGLLSVGVASFPLIAFHAQSLGGLSAAQIPLLFALAMAVDGLSGLVVGRLYDTYGPYVLLAVPVAAAISALTFSANAGLIWAGVAVWGLVSGVLDSTAKAVVSDLVPHTRRAVAFGWLSFVRGLALLAGGGLLGFLYDVRLSVLITAIVAVNAAALVGLGLVLRRIRGSSDLSVGS